MICKENGYRYYSRETLLTVPIVKYYKQMGFKLEEMQDLVEGNTYYFVKQNFISKIDELRIQEQEIHNSYMAVKDWYELIQEAQDVYKRQVLYYSYLRNAVPALFMWGNTCHNCVLRSKDL